MKFAFIVLSHSNPGQLLRLTETLMRLYESPQVVCHHDFKLCALDENKFPSGCRFVRPHIDTQWGDMSVLRAGLSAIEALYQRDGWDWFFLLSGSDYPVATAESVRRELRSANFDVLLNSRLVEYDREVGEGPDQHGQFTFSRPYWPSLAYDRYVAYHAFSYPSLTKRFKPCKRRLRIIDPMWLKLLRKWPSFRIYGGDQWLGGNRRTAEVLIRHPQRRAILTFFNSKFAPDEAAYHTLICNSDLSLSRLGSRRFSKWSDVSGHPDWLAKEDFKELISSNAWFARKFLPNDPVLDALDDYLRID